VKTKLLLLIGPLLGILSCKNPIANLGLPAKDEARLAAPIPVPNGDFENWNWQLRPISWYTNGCPLCVGAQWDEYVVKQDSQTVYHGKYSAQLMYNYSFQAYAKIKFALSIHPSSLQAYVTCHLYTPDTVSINIKLYKHKHVVDSGYWQSTASITNFTQINIPLSTNAALIDSAQILIKGGKTIAPNNYNSSTLWVDDLSFFK